MKKREISEYGDQYTLIEFIQAVEDGLFTDDDGSGYYATEDHYFPDLPAFPSEINRGKVNYNYNFVAWFSK